MSKFLTAESIDVWRLVIQMLKKERVYLSANITYPDIESKKSEYSVIWWESSVTANLPLQQTTPVCMHTHTLNNPTRKTIACASEHTVYPATTPCHAYPSPPTASIFAFRLCTSMHTTSSSVFYRTETTEADMDCQTNKMGTHVPRMLCIFSTSHLPRGIWI